MYYNTKAVGEQARRNAGASASPQNREHPADFGNLISGAKYLLKMYEKKRIFAVHAQDFSEKGLHSGVSCGIINKKITIWLQKSECKRRKG